MFHRRPHLFYATLGLMQRKIPLVETWQLSLSNLVLLLGWHCNCLVKFQKLRNNLMTFIYFFAGPQGEIVVLENGKGYRA